MVDSSEPQMTVDLTNCDREPIHLLGRVQTCGFLVATTADWLVSNVSANISDFVKADVNALIGAHISNLIPPDTIHTLRNRLQNLTANAIPAVVSNIELAGANHRFDINIHISGKKIILEFEPALAQKDLERDLETVQQSINRMSALTDVNAILKFATRFCAALTGYDRVMAYMFREDDSGEVRAETCAPDMEPYLGLRYPASDIPKQARELYKRSPVRSINDSNSIGVPILPAPMHQGDAVDLSNAVLRSVSPIHLEYLRNMGVAASLSISIVVEGELFGLIACHHRKPKHLHQSHRSSMVLFAQMLSLIIEGKLTAQSNNYKEAASDLINRFSRSATTTGDISTVILDQCDKAMELMSADGIAVVSDDTIKLAGKTPTTDEVKILAKRLNTQPSGEIFSSHELATFLPEAADFVPRAAGMLSIPISKSPRDYIMFFRQEVVQSVNWAGNPEKPATLGPNGVRLTPRKSFQTWRALVEGQSEAWTASEIAAAEQFRVTVLELVLKLVDDAVVEKKKANEKQELLIAELNHRVRNILGLVQSLISQTSKKEATVSDFAKVLESRIQSLARAHDLITKQNWSSASFKELIQTETKAYLHQKSTRVQITGPDIEVAPVAFSTLALVMHELITNSAKYGSLSDQRGAVKLGISVRDDGSLDISWREVGGPAVKAPTRRGFGSVITEKSIPFELNGESKIDYHIAGVRAKFWIPASHITKVVHGEELSQAEAPETDSAETAVKETVPFPKNILLVEDNMIIAMDTEGVLMELGAQSVRVCADVETSLDFIDKTKFDFAILDVNLGSETSLEVAHKLNAINIPFIFASGYGESQILDAFDTKVDTISKPYDKERLKKAILDNAKSG